MPTRNVSLTLEQDAFIAKVVEAGEYQNASEAIRDALRALQQRRREDALRLTALRAEIERGIRDLDRGAFVEIDDAELDRYFAHLTPRPPARSRRRTRATR
jgi:antitoxin ParD1/3/4